MTKMDFFVPKFIKYQLYLLQLENYELGRYWKLLWTKGFWPRFGQAQRKDLVWTSKAKALMLMAWALHGLVMVLVASAILTVTPSLDNAFTGLIFGAVILLPFYFILFSAALVIIKPLDATVKKNLAKKAQLKIQSLKNLKIIGVAGSYGKTTMKEVLGQALGAGLKVLVTPESVNTPVGIAKFILGKVNSETQVLILELGEHYRGDIKELCAIARPDIAVFTGINEAHLERMKSMDTITATIFEAAEFAKTNALVVLNGDDERIVNQYQKYTGSREVRFYASGSGGRTDYLVADKQFDPKALVWNFTIQHHGSFGLPLLGDYAIGDAVAAVAIGEYLGLGLTDIKVGLSRAKPVEHRLQPIRSAGEVLVIDDSYNGNPAGVAEAIKLLSQFEGRRKIYITPGLVEIGAETAAIHRQIGRQLAQTVDVVVLVKNSVTPYIEEGLVEQGATQISGSGPHIRVLEHPEVMWFNSAPEMHEALKKIIRPGDVVLFQNDWGDQYI